MKTSPESEHIPFFASSAEPNAPLFSSLMVMSPPFAGFVHVPSRSAVGEVDVQLPRHRLGSAPVLDAHPLIGMDAAGAGRADYERRRKELSVDIYHVRIHVGRF